MKQRISSRELEDAAASAARASGEFSKRTKLMKVVNRGSSSSSTPPPPYHNSLFRGRLPEQQQPSSSTITEVSSIRRRTELLPNQAELPQQQQQPTRRISNRMYTCKTCGRQFETFQALGGHRASHKMKLVGGPGIVGEDGSYQQFQYKAKLHRCSICNKGYQTGQALGGHMRKHRELLENQRLAAADAEAAHQNVSDTNHQSNAQRWAQMNAAAIFQYSNPPPQRYNNAPHPPPAETEAVDEAGPEAALTDPPPQRYNNAPHPPPAETEVVDASGPEAALREKVPTRKGFNFDLNLDVLENEELGLGSDE